MEATFSIRGQTRVSTCLTLVLETSLVFSSPNNPIILITSPSVAMLTPVLTTVLKASDPSPQPRMPAKEVAFAYGSTSTVCSPGPGVTVTLLPSMLSEAQNPEAIGQRGRGSEEATANADCLSRILVFPNPSQFSELC